MNKIKTYTLQGLFILLSTVIVFSVLSVVSYLISSRPQDEFWDYVLNFIKFGLYAMANILLIAGIVFVMMHYLTKIYKKLFFKS